MNKNSPLTKEFFNNWLNIRKESERLEARIIERMSYIIHKSCQMFGNSVSTWFFEDVSEREVGNVCNAIIGTEFTPSLIFSNIKHSSMCVILNDESEINLIQDGFPVRWLFEDFEREIAEGKEKYRQKEITRNTELNRLSEEKRIRQLELVKSAKEKLSREELEAVKKYL